MQQHLRNALIASSLVVGACSSPETRPAPDEPTADRTVASAEPAPPPEPKLPDCTNVTPAPTFPKRASWIAKATHEPARPDAIATVGDQIVPRASWDAIVHLKIAKYIERGRKPPETALRRYQTSIAQRLVGEEIVRQEAAAKGVTHDPVALRRRTAMMRRGIDDWPKHLERRGETDETLRGMYVAELLELALTEAEAPIEVSQEEVSAYYCRQRQTWTSTKERRLLTFWWPASPEIAEQVRTALSRSGATVEQVLEQYPDVAAFPHQLHEVGEGELSSAIDSAEVGVPTIVPEGEGGLAVIFVEHSLPPGTLPSKIALELAREGALGNERRRRTTQLQTRLVDESKVVVYGVPPVPEP